MGQNDGMELVMKLLGGLGLTKPVKTTLNGTDGKQLFADLRDLFQQGHVTEVLKDVPQLEMALERLVEYGKQHGCKE